MMKKIILNTILFMAGIILQCSMLLIELKYFNDFAFSMTLGVIINLALVIFLDDFFKKHF